MLASVTRALSLSRSLARSLAHARSLSLSHTHTHPHPHLIGISNALTRSLSPGSYTRLSCRSSRTRHPASKPSSTTRRPGTSATPSPSPWLCYRLWTTPCTRRTSLATIALRPTPTSPRF
ncbi:hypothetical protein T484DRAFT_2475502 [Baffinella frigidus]|nr:hypothetical protein T484DRAFT_2475502 [Cryptophyta sp. CCMP2293]